MDDVIGDSTGAGRPPVPRVAVCPAHLTATAMVTHPPMILRSKSHAHLPTHAVWYVSTGMWSCLALTLKRLSCLCLLEQLYVCWLIIGQCSPWWEADRPKASSEIRGPKGHQAMVVKKARGNPERPSRVGKPLPMQSVPPAR